MSKATQWSISKRPHTLDEVYGCSTVKKFCQTAVKKDEWPTAIALSGKYGTGKTTSAKIIAQMLVCQHPTPEGNPCCECSSCKAIIDESFNRDVVMINAGQTGKSELTDQLVGLASVQPFRDKRKVIIIEEVQELSEAAKNSLLKMLESPQPNIHWLLTSMEPLKAGGLASRCMNFKFQSAKTTDIMKYLYTVLNQTEGKEAGSILWKELAVHDDVAFRTEGIKLIAESANGSYRQALQTLQQVIEAEVFDPNQIAEEFGLVSEVDVMDAFYDVAANDRTPTAYKSIIQCKDPSALLFIGLKCIADAESYRIFGKVDSDNKWFESKAKALCKMPNYSKLRDVLHDMAGRTFVNKNNLVIALMSCYSD